MPNNLPKTLILFSALFLTLFLHSAQAQPDAGKTWYQMGKEETDQNRRILYFTRALEQEKKDNWTYYRRAWSYYGLGKYEKARSDFHSAEKAKEGNLDMSFVWSGLAWTYYKIRKYDKGRIYADKAKQAKPGNADVWNVSGWLYVGKNENEKAIKEFTQYIKLKPDITFGYSNRAFVYSRLEQYDKVIADCNAGLKIDPKDELMIERKALALLRSGREEEGIELIKSKIDYKSNDPQSLSNIGNLFFQAGEYEVAIEYHTKGIELYKKLIEEDPDYIRIYREAVYNIYYSRGDCYNALKEYQNALANYSEATRINKDDYRAWIEIGELQTLQNNYKEAIHAFENGFRLKPDHNYGWVNLGFCYDNLNLKEKAIDAYSRGLKVRPNEGLLWNNRGYSYLELKQYDKAKSDLLQAIKVQPTVVMSHISLGEYYYFKGEYSQAIKKLSEALAMKNGSMQAYRTGYYTRGIAKMKLKQYDSAEKDFAEAIKLDPRHALSHEQIGIAHFLQKEECEAYKHLKKALEIDSPKREKEIKNAASYLAKLTRNPCN